MSDKPWSAAAQRRRYLDLTAWIRRTLRPRLDEQGEAPKLLWWDQPRVRLWSTQAFFEGDADDFAFGNLIIRTVRDALELTPGTRPFESSGIASIFAHHEDKLEADVAEWLRDILLAMAHYGTTRDFQFHGYNDNMPVMWAWAHTFAGERFGDEYLREVGHANLRQLGDLLRRRGTVAEFGLGYATHRLTGLALVGEHAQDEEIRDLARKLEARIWAEHAGHWHPELGALGGASMRGTHLLSAETSVLFAQVFGREIARPWMAVEETFDRRDLVEQFGLDPEEYRFAYGFGYPAEFSGATYHVPDAVAALFYEKEKPFRFACTAECGYVNEGLFREMRKVKGQGGVTITSEFTDKVVEIEDFPQVGAQPYQLVTWHGENYSLGTCTRNMFTTTYAMRCMYRRATQARSWADIGACTMRYNTNEKVPGGLLPNQYPLAPDRPMEKENYCRLYRDTGRHVCLQHEDTVLCLSTPEYREWWDVRDLRLDIVFQQTDARVGHWEIAGDGSRVDVEDGEVYLSFRPLIGRRLECEEAIRVREINEWLVISFYNYQGPSRRFGKREIAKLGNGFAMEVRDASEYKSLAAFQAELDRARVLDQLYGGRRRVVYARPDLRLTTQYCPYTDHVMQASVNGLEAPMEKLRFSNGIESQLPFMDGTPAPGFADWDWLQTQFNRKIEPYNPQD